MPDSPRRCDGSRRPRRKNPPPAFTTLAAASTARTTARTTTIRGAGPTRLKRAFTRENTSALVRSALGGFDSARDGDANDDPLIEPTDGAAAAKQTEPPRSAVEACAARVKGANVRRGGYENQNQNQNFGNVRRRRQVRNPRRATLRAGDALSRTCFATPKTPALFSDTSRRSNPRGYPRVPGQRLRDGAKGLAGERRRVGRRMRRARRWFLGIVSNSST